MPLAVTGTGGGPCHLNGLAPARGRGRTALCLGTTWTHPTRGRALNLPPGGPGRQSAITTPSWTTVKAPDSSVRRRKKLSE